MDKMAKRPPGYFESKNLLGKVLTDLNLKWNT